MMSTIHPAKVVILLACASGCDLLFQVDRIGSSRDGGTTTDGPMPGEDSGGGMPCVGAIINDGFPGPAVGKSVCRSWGNAYVNGGATITESNGLMIVTPATAGSSYAGCISSTNHTFGKGGVAVAVGSVLSGNNAFTLLKLHGSPMHQIIVTADGMLRFQNGPQSDLAAPVTHTPETKWWRMRPQGLDVLLAEYSSDGVGWVPWGQANTPSMPTVTFEISSGTAAGVAIGQTVFERLRLCPLP
jgi:hypothetical protein